MADRRLLENGTDKRLLEDGTSFRLLEQEAYAALVLSLSPVAYWRLGEAAGTQAVAAIGPHGSYVASPTLGAAGALTGDTNTGVTLDGSTEYVTVPHDTALNYGDVFTLLAWVKRAGNGEQWIIQKGSGSGGMAFDFDNTLRMTVANVAHVGNSTVAITDTNWHMLAVTKNGTARKLYVDGADVTAALPANDTAGNTTDALEIGRWYGGAEYVNGSMDEVALFASVLTSTNISDLYAAATSAGVTVTPTTASLTLATFAPTVTATAPQLVTPTTASLTTATFAPVIRLTVTPTTAALTLTTFAPTVTATAHQLVTPSTASLVTATFAPTVSTPRLAVPTTASLVLTTFAPTVSTPRLAVPTTAALTLTTFAPTVSATAHVTLTPTTASLTLTTFAPTVTANAGLTVTPTTASLTLTTFAPTVTTTAHVTVVPGLAALSLTTFAPTVLTPRLVVPGVAALVTATFAPLVGVTDHKLVTPGLVTLALGTFAPTVSASGGVLIISPPGTRLYEVGVTRTNGMAEELNDRPVIVEVK